MASAHRRYICIHGHFYQPPRENAWLEVIEVQESAAPFHDWNERIDYECYAPNAAARILDKDNYIVDIINNYAWISFNFGPTLLSWLSQADPDTYRAIQEADRQSARHFGGHGSAMAQAYNHLIMPLANARDKETQVIWGKRDFAFRFGRVPEGMWLPETAVDTATLEVLAAHDIKFTVLAPRQAKAWRRLGETQWVEGGVDTRRPYLCRLPSGRTIALFFYDGEVAQEVAFKGLLHSGKDYARRLVGRFDQSSEPQLVHVATDGESYGHHHRYGEMALADCLNTLRGMPEVQLTNYAWFLEQHPPTYEVQIHENSSWSCVHGVERWRSDCGCHTGGAPGWNQAWRAPLRETLDWLRDQLAPIFERYAARYLSDPWQARNDYIDLILDRSPARVDAFLRKHGKKDVRWTDEVRTTVLRLMEMQRHAQLMFTSCGWFFNEISGLETNQILQYANRAIEYAWTISGKDLHAAFVRRLEQAPSNVYENGAVAYRRFVLPARVGLERVGMHYAAASLFEEEPEHMELLNFSAHSEAYRRKRAGTYMMAVGRTRVTSKVTFSEKRFSFAVLYLGQQNIVGHISTGMSPATFAEMQRQVFAAFHANDLAEVIRLMHIFFGEENFSINHLFLDERRRILLQILAGSLARAEVSVRNIFEDNYQLMAVMRDSGIPIPETWKNAAQFVLNADLLHLLENGKLRVSKLQQLEEEFKRWNVELTNVPALERAAEDRIYRLIQALEKEDTGMADLEQAVVTIETLRSLGLKLELWKAQNAWFWLAKASVSGRRQWADQTYAATFARLGELLRIRMPRQNEQE